MIESPLARIHLRLLTLFSEVDDDARALSSRAGLRCPEGCGRCCESPAIHTSATELLPLAWHLHSQGSAEEWHQRVRERGAGVCVFYEPEGEGRGRCGVYALRPLVCRLFGFAAVRDKHGAPRLAGCAMHRQTQPEAVARAEEAVRQGAPVSVFSEVTFQAGQIDPGRASAPVPINQALREAIEIVFLRSGSMQQEPEAAPEEVAEIIPLPRPSPTSPDTNPRRPQRPRRRCA